MRRNEDSHVEQQYDGHVEEWMKTHSIKDLKLMAYQMDQHGEDTFPVWDLINDLKVMSR
ncbi:MAG: hypothetical protein NT131_03065 [Methanomassiliicoccales archaeon]|nr:hypothetical protein [Methanomassiliicoccales archaeon]